MRETIREQSTVDSPVRIIQVGAGVMGQWWLRILGQSPDTELVGLVDLDLDAARAAAAAAGFGEVPLSTSLSSLAETLDADAVLNVTVPAAHNSVNAEAFAAGMPVLCEKPIAPTVADALVITACAEAKGQLLMISQSRRYLNHLTRLRQSASMLGRLGAVQCDFRKTDRPNEFRGLMPHPLLVDTAIHHFDMARYLLTGCEPVAVYCETFNPGWSLYGGHASASAVIEFAGGTRFIYNGSLCVAGHETSWNGLWHVYGERGSVIWDDQSLQVSGEHLPIDEPVSKGAFPEEIAGSLTEFVDALRTGKVPYGEAHHNVLSLAMVEAAVRSAETRERVAIVDVLIAALRQAVHTVDQDDARRILEKWEHLAEHGEVLAPFTAAG